MKKLFFILSLLINIASLHGMEVPNKPNHLKLPLVYRHLPKIYFQWLKAGLLPEIIQHIFSLQFDIDHKQEIDQDIHSLVVEGSAENLVNDMDMSLMQYGYHIAIERLKRNLATKKISLCEVRIAEYTVLHAIARDVYGDKKINLAKLFLEAAGTDTWKLLKEQTILFRMTALHYAAMEVNPQLVKLFLDTAGDQAQALIDILDDADETAFKNATPEIKEIMQLYLEKK